MQIDPFFDKCLAIIKQPAVQNEIKSLLKPLIDLILIEINPYIYLSLLFVMFSFFLLLGIFILLLRNKSLFR